MCNFSLRNAKKTYSIVNHWNELFKNNGDDAMKEAAFTAELKLSGMCIMGLA